jgi:signal transduction histidine kinase/ActR/RegA family two-component response regulator
MDDDWSGERSEDTEMRSFASLEGEEADEFDISEDDVAHLIVFKPTLDGSVAGQTHVIRDEVVIGRSSDADIQINSTDVSRRHAKILQMVTGEFVVEDLGSRNGILVNDAYVTKAELSPGDKIRIGTKTILIFTRYHPLETQMRQAQKLESLGRLAAGIAHEINNPLTYVYYNLESLTTTTSKLASEMINILHESGQLRRRLTGLVDQEEVERLIGAAEEAARPDTLESLTESLVDARDGVRRMMEIVQDLKFFSGTAERRLVPVDLNEVIEGAAKILQNEIRFRAKLVKEYGEIPSVLGDEGRLAQVFLNLLMNAAHAIDEGNVEQNTISVRTWAEGDEVLAEVRDTGEGVAPEHLKHIFEPFFSTKERGRGAGLGLSICHNIITSHGGKIDVESGPGEDTRFIVALPKTTFQRQQRSTAETQPVIHQLEMRPGRVLVVDDEPGIGAAIRRMLFEHHEVQMTTSTAEAKRLLEYDRAFDLILCDLLMPESSGIDLYEWLRESYPRLAEQVVFMTGGAFTPQALAFVREAPNPVLEKPIELETLQSLIRERTRFKS